MLSWGPHVGKMATYPLPSWGSPMWGQNQRWLHNSCCLGAHMWVRWLYILCRLGGPPCGDKIRGGYITHAVLGPTCGQNGYITHAVLGVPNLGENSEAAT